MDPSQAPVGQEPGDVDEALEWHRIAEERRRQLERIRLDRRFQLAAGLLSIARRTMGPVLRAGGRGRSSAARVLRSLVAVPARVRAPARERRLRSALASLPEPRPHRPAADLVTAVIVTAAQPRRLDALLAALSRIGVRALVVDNAGQPDIAAVIERHRGAERIELSAARSFAAANEVAMPHVVTPWTLFLNDDVRPLEDTWVDRMLAAADSETVAVGALLVHGRRGWLGGAAVDLRVQHAGVGIVLDGAVPTPVHLGRGRPPEPRSEAPAVIAATAACLLVRTSAHRSVGGFHRGFDYGMEDVDLCLRLAQQGSIRVALDAVLLHEEGATRLDSRSGPPSRVRRERQVRNRALLLARHGVALRRGAVTGAFVPAAPLRISVAGPLPSGLEAPPECAIEAVNVRRRRMRRRLATSAAIIVTRAEGLHPRMDAPTATVVAPVIAWGERAAQGVQDGRWRGPAPDAVVAAESPSDLQLADLLAMPRWSVRIGAPPGRRGLRWGDVTVARAICDELRAHGIVARVTTIDGWGSGFDATADVTVHLKGRGVAPTADGQCNVVWIMSHPSELAPGELDRADLVLAGSSMLRERLARLTPTPSYVLPQAADVRSLLSSPTGVAPASRVLFIGNTRSASRPVVVGALQSGLPVTLVGSGWERYADAGRVLRRSVPYEALGDWYRSAEIVLNDHWDDMARWGLVSNRVFDALACGACVVSDEVPGMSELLDDAVVTVRDAADVGPTVRALLDDPDARASRAERGRRVVLAAHTWEHRATELVRLVSSVTTGRGGSA
jgi:GT2 family glycosyltransferase